MRDIGLVILFIMMIVLTIFVGAEFKRTVEYQNSEEYQWQIHIVEGK
jgi:hypothetical protein